MTTPAIRRFNTELNRYHHAQAAEKKAVAGEKKATAADKKDVAGEKTALANIDAQKQQVLDSFSQAIASGQPIDPAALTQDFQKMIQFGQKSAQTKDSFDQRIASDKATMKKDKTAEKKDLTAEKKDRKAALKDLKPAEYDMNLKQTNAARKELGLNKVNHVVRPPHPTVGGQVGKWISQAQEILAQHGIPYSKMNAKDLNIIIQHESSGNPNAQNNWDSNAAAGHPSIGLMQTIGPTFNSYKLPGHGNIRNPIDNIIAGVRYAVSRYGSISNVPGVVDVHHGRAYVGY
jgi:hypothetical protein